MAKKIRSLAVLCSGGDAPGMNAALRSVVRTALAQGVSVYGVRKGYRGLLEGNWYLLDRKSVANILQRGGTHLKTDRCPEFLQKKNRAMAAKRMREAGIDALVVIGGDGSFRGADLFSQESRIPVVGIPGTIDNDIFGTDETIGFDTAVNNALDAIDKIRDTASAHERTFIVEVMGRNSGYIALEVGIGGGAEAIVVPEQKLSVSEVASRIHKGMERGKTSSIIVMAEGQKGGDSVKLAERLQKEYGISAKLCILGHVQRGGAPSARDRRLGSILGYRAVLALLKGKSRCMVGVAAGKDVLVPFAKTRLRSRKFRQDWVKMADLLAT